ncbi:MAG: hypothetical protein ACHBN1_09770 [Heteroscytonema crispum UTEX LB 1556]
MASKNTGLKDMEAQATTRVLLALWDLGGAKQEVKRSEVTDRAKRSSEKAGDYKSVLDKLEKAGTIKIAKKNRTETVLLTDKGLQMLHEGLKSSEFEYDSNVGAKTANALLKWIRQMDGVVASSAAPAKEKAIASYDEFKSEALEVYDKLNHNYNLNDLVPIYRIRREIGDRISRENFNEWLLEMQANDIFQLMAGEMPDITPDKREDSITIPGGGLRYYAKHLS